MMAQASVDPATHSSSIPIISATATGDEAVAVAKKRYDDICGGEERLVSASEVRLIPSLDRIEQIVSRRSPSSD